MTKKKKNSHFTDTTQNLKEPKIKKFSTDGVSRQSEGKPSKGLTF